MQMRTMLLPIDVRAMLVAVHDDGYAVAEDREQRANRYRDRAHRPNVPPDRYAKSCGARSRNGPAESRDDTHGHEKGGRADREAFDPGRYARASVTENGADATTAKISIASG